MRKAKLALDAPEVGFLFRVLTEKRNELITKDKPTEIVDSLIVKTCDAKRKGLDNYEAR